MIPSLPFPLPTSQPLYHLINLHRLLWSSVKRFIHEPRWDGYRILEKGVRETDRRWLSPVGGCGHILHRKKVKIEILGWDSWHFEAKSAWSALTAKWSHALTSINCLYCILYLYCPHNCHRRRLSSSSVAFLFCFSQPVQSRYLYQACLYNQMSCPRVRCKK